MYYMLTPKPHPVFQRCRSEIPIFYSNSMKKSVRLKNFEIYRDISGKATIDRSRDYWTLCSIQPDVPDAEINQAISVGVLHAKAQFNGVDRKAALIEENRRTHPEARWYCGEWLEVIKRTAFNPALVYLDSMSVAGYSAALSLLTETLIQCPEACVVLCNLITENPYNKRHHPVQSSIEAASKVPGWNFAPDCSYSYKSCRTQMTTLAFYKP